MGHSAGDRKGVKGHSCFNEAVFYELSPDLVVPWPTQDVGRSGEEYRKPSVDLTPNALMRGVLGTRRFQENYVTVFFPVPGKPASARIIAYGKPAVVNRLRSRGVNLAVLEWSGQNSF
jgi:hypothetical protein